MLCLHGEPAGSRFMKVYNERQMLPSQRTFWYCKQSSTCHFELCGYDKYKALYCDGVKTFLATNQELPKCCAVNKSPMNDEHGVERNNAKMKVVTMKKESFGRPYFVCSKENNRCNYFEWGDQIIVEKPLCKHGNPSRMLVVKKEGPNKGRKFFCCAEQKEKDCKFFKWFEDQEELED